MATLSSLRSSVAGIGLALSLGFAGCSSRGGLERPLVSGSTVHSSGFENSLGSLLGGTLVPGNRITTLRDGDEIFPAMLAGIGSARRTITFESFVFYHGDVPAQFAAALAERARAGVKVKVILDANGAKKSRRYHRDLRDAGVDLVIYHRALWPDIRRYNHRTHRKLLVIDGTVGFIGGVGIADEWKGRASKPDEWRDLHYRVEGPVVAQLQGAFNDNWFKSRKEILHGPEYFPPLRSAGSARAGVFFSSPRHGRHTVDLMYHLALSAARESVMIENAYFLPDDALVDALCATAHRGVKVRVIMPGEHIDQKAVRRASRKRWPKLLAAGVELYEFKPTMIHSKLLIVDGRFVSVGSSNFDPRSLAINDEANLNVLDPAFAREQTGLFLRDLRLSEPVKGRGSKPADVAELPVQAAQAPVESQL
jgi:cardiolipin synthase